VAGSQSGRLAPGICWGLRQRFEASRCDFFVEVRYLRPGDAAGFGIGTVSRHRNYPDSATLVGMPGGAQGSLYVGGRLNRGPSEIFQASNAGGASVALALTDIPTPTGAVAILPGIRATSRRGTAT
jgi:hypothetical protein